LDINQVILDNQKTVGYYAKKYHYLSDSREDLLQDLNLYLIESLSRYQGKMTNMRSLITLIIKRRVGRLLDHRYGNNGYIKKEDILRDPADFDIYYYEMDDILSGIEIDIENFDAESKKIIMMVIEGYTKKEIAEQMGVCRQTFYLYHLRDVMEKMGKLFREYGYEVQAV